MVETDKFQKRTYQDRGKTLPYRLFVPPGQAAGGKLPMVLFLHGMGERGLDNERQLLVGPGATVWTRPENLGSRPCFVMAPQCPEDTTWSSIRTLESSPHESEPTYALRMALEALDQLQQEFHADEDRLYITGLSMGGYGTWDAILRCPHRFAAAVPVCGGGAPSLAGRITHIPIWAFHGDADETVPPDRSREMIEAVRTAGGNPRYTEYSGVGHNSWDAAYNEPDLPSWLFGQRRAG